LSLMLSSNDAHGLAQGVFQEIVGVFHSRGCKVRFLSARFSLS
jgi:hypothetical protein